MAAWHTATRLRQHPCSGRMSACRARAGAKRWAKEVAEKGTFMSPYAPEVAAAQPGGLPVPLLLVATKADLRSTPPDRGLDM